MTIYRRTTHWVLFSTMLMAFIGSVQLIHANNVSTENDLTRNLVRQKMDPVIHPLVWKAAGKLSPDEKIAVWVFFTDKGIFSDSEYTLSRQKVVQHFTGRAKWRRSKVNREIDFTDLPVRGDYIRTIIYFGATYRATSKWFNGISIEVLADKLERIAALPFVREIQLVHRSRREPIRIKKGANTAPLIQQTYQLDYGPSFGQLEQINVPAVHELGYTGVGVILLMLDTGYNVNHEAFQHLNIIAEYDFINKDRNTGNEPDDPRGQHDHGTATLSAAAGANSGNLYGPAYGADILLAKTEDISSETPVEEDYWVAAIEWADSIGADIASSSLIYLDWYTYEDMDGNTATITRAADMAAAKGILVCNAAGNERNDDWFYMAAPSDADSILACGAVDEDGRIAFFSSSGPTVDGRTKPEVVARGLSTHVAESGNTSGYYDGVGTSFATPLVAGAAALVLEAHPEWTPMQVREALMLTADRADEPDNLYGWGIPDVLAAINYQPSRIKGDVNSDGAVNLLDAVMTAYIILGLNQPGPGQLWAADCNDDGSINVLDIICIARIIIGDE